MVTKILVGKEAGGKVAAVPSASGARVVDDNENCVNEQLTKEGEDDKKCAPTKERHESVQLGSIGRSDICQGHSKHDVTALSMPTDGTIDEGKLAASASAMPPPNNDETKKRSLATDNEDDNGQKKSRTAPIDLSDVPDQPTILREGKRGSSKYQGVYLDKAMNKWKAQIGIDGKQRHIGYYDTEEDAAADYARAVFKHAPKKLEQKQKQIRIDLTDVPSKPPILKVGGKIGTSKYQGVSLDKSTNKWLAQIAIDGKKRHIGRYDIEEEAAADYARAVFKYKEGKTEVAHQQKQSTDAAEKFSVPEGSDKCGTSQLKGVLASTCVGDGLGHQGMMGDAAGVGSMVPEAAIRMHPAFRSGKMTSTHITEGWSVLATATACAERHPSSMLFSFDGAPAGVAATATNGDSSNVVNDSQEMPQLPESSENSSNTGDDVQRLLKQNQFLEDSLMKAQAEIQFLKDMLMKTQAPAAGVLGSADGSANKNKKMYEI